MLNFYFSSFSLSHVFKLVPVMSLHLLLFFLLLLGCSPLCTVCHCCFLSPAGTMECFKLYGRKKSVSSLFISLYCLPFFKVNVDIQWNIFDPRPYFPAGLLLPSVQCVQQQGFPPEKNNLHVQCTNFIKLSFFCLLRIT